ncbi:hypothetical protein ACF0H5_019225 [Mactra antiquata]
MGQFWTKIFKHKDIRILLLGLDGAGKTTLLYRLKLGDVVTHIPTIGFNVEQLVYKNISFTAWDIGARDKMRPLFRHYYKGTDAVVMVIDSSDGERLEELYCDVLKPALNAEELANSIFLFLVNKKDLPNTLTKEEVILKLNLKTIKHTWSIIETSAILGDGLTESMDWLASKLGSHSTPTKKSATQSLYQKTLHDSSPSKKSTNQNAPKSSHENSPTHCDKNVDTKDKTTQKDYCTRAYSAFKCFFIRPNVPPDFSD